MDKPTKPDRSAYDNDYQYRQAMRTYQQNMQMWRQRSGSSGGRRGGARRFGTGESGGDRRWTPPVHGTTSDGRAVTASFSRTDEESLLRDGHAGSPEGFYGNRGDKQHDHYDGRGGGTTRGRYTGKGS